MGRTARAAAVRAAAALAAALLSAAPAAAQQETGAAAPVGGADEFIMRRGDVLELTVWPDTVLSGSYPIEDDGYVHLPALGAVPAGGRSLETLRSDIRNRYRRELRNPVITLMPRFQVSVLGAVERPGLYEANSTQTIFDVISLAGGFRPEAERDDVRVIRADGGVVEVNAEDAIDEGRDALDLGLRSRDRIIVPRSRFDFGVQDVLYLLQSVALVITLID